MTSDTATRYPLSWPAAWKRTPAHQRKPAAWGKRVTTTNAIGEPWARSERLTIADALDRLTGELRRLGAQAVVISTNVPTRNDGLPYSRAAEPADSGAAVYFRLAGKPRVLACDRWKRVADNLAAVAAHIEAIRAVDRYGVGTIEQAFAGYAALPPAEDWRTILGFRHDEQPTRDSIQSQFRLKAACAHPDVGGSHDEMTRLNAARAAALEEVRE